MASLFISYSRKDIEGARRLTEAFKGQDWDFWIDWAGIPPTVDWWKEIEKSIEEKDIFLFLLSPDSCKSKVCKQEIEHAARNGKRLIPVVIRDIQSDECPNELSHLNWVYLRENDDFKISFDKLVTAIKTDYAWVQVHRQLQVKALEWERSDRENGFLLHGEELREAEWQLTTNASKEPHPTDLQRKYVLESRQAADKQRRTFTGIAITVGIVLILLGAFGWIQAGRATTNAQTAQTQRFIAVAESTRAVNNAETAQAESTRAFNNAGTAEVASTQAIAQADEAKEQAKIARSRELAALALAKSQNYLDLSLLLSLQAYHTSDNYQTRGAMLDVLRTAPSLLQFFHTQAVSVAFSPDGEYVVLGGPNNTARVLEIATGEEITRMTHNGSVRSVVFSPHGKYVVSGGWDNSVRIWEVSTGKEIARLTHDDSVYSVAFSPDGKYVVSGSSDNSVRIWEVSTGKEIARLTHDDSVYSVAFSPDGKTIATSVYTRSNGIVILWDMETHQLIGQISSEWSTLVESVDFSPDGKTLASGGCASSDFLGNCEGGGIDLWDVASRKSISHLFTGRTKFNPSVRGVAFSPDGRTLISSGDKVILWDVTGNQPISQPLHVNTSIVKRVAFSPDGKILASGILDGSVILWDVASRQPMGQPLREHMSIVWSVAFSPDGKIIASAGCGSNDCQKGQIILWDVSSRQPIGRMINRHTLGSHNVAVRPSENVMAHGAVHRASISSNMVRHSALSQPLLGGSLVMVFIVWPSARMEKL